MTADAKEYRESLAIENAIKDNPVEREAWIKRQDKLEFIATTLAEPAEADEEEE